MLSIFLNFVYTEHQKLNIDKPVSVGSSILNILQQTICFYLVQFLTSFNLKYENCKFSR